MPALTMRGHCLIVSIQAQVKVQPVVCSMVAGTMIEIYDLGQFLLCEVIRSDLSVELRQAEDDRIGTISRGSSQAIPAAGWGEEFGGRRYGRQIMKDENCVMNKCRERLSDFL